MMARLRPGIWLAVLFALLAAGCSGTGGSVEGPAETTSTGEPAPAAVLRTVSPGAFRVDFKVTSDWGSGFGASLDLVNTGTAPLEDWRLEFDFPYSITSLWNARVVSRSGSRYVLGPESWTRSIPAGGRASIGFNGEPGNVTSPPANYSLTAGGSDPTPSPSPSAVPGPSPSPSGTPGVVSLAYRTTNDWGSGFEGEVTVRNQGTVALTGWTLEFDLDARIGSIWNVTVAGLSGNRYTVAPKSWNGRIEPGGTVAFGFIAAPGGGSGARNLVLRAREGTFGAAPGPSPSPSPSPQPSPAPSPQPSPAPSPQPSPAPSPQPSPSPSPAPSPSPTPPPVTAGRKLVAYFAEWGIYQREYYVSDVPAEQVDVLNYAFADISSAGEVTLFDSWAAVERPFPGDTWDQPLKGNFNQLARLKARHPHLATLISVGGWTLSGRFSDVALTPASREKFARSAVRFMKQYGFDGVDIDWEYPGGGGLDGNVDRPEDPANFTLLLAELRLRLDEQGAADGRRYYLTIAAPAGHDKYRKLDLARVAGLCDWINLMTYDFHGGWENRTGHHSALFANPADPNDPGYVSDFAVRGYLDAGVPAGKLLLGIPAYGRSWKNVAPANHGLFAPASGVPYGTWDDTGMFDYKDLVGKLKSAPSTWLRYWDDQARAPWIHAPALNNGTFVTYEDPQSLAAKLDYLAQKGLGGMMLWELSSDVKDPADPDSLVGRIRQAFGPR